jgi:hypothetical protein
MDQEIKKRTVVDRIKNAYISACRDAGVEAEAPATIYLNTDDIPTGAGIDFNELGIILLAIEQDDRYRGHIILETLDEHKNGSRRKQTSYRIQVNHGLFLRGALADKKPRVFLVKGWWTISLPGKGSKEVRIAKQGTLTGELLAILGQSWGTVRKTDVIYDLLRQRVTNKATEGRPDDQNITNAMKEINRRLKEGGHPGIKLIRKPDSLGGTWKLMLDIRSAKPKVDSSGTRKSTKRKKR